MTRIYLGVGSNLNRRRSIRAGIAALQEAFAEVQVSPIYRCPAEGFDGPEFFNLVVSCETDLDPESVDQQLKRIEQALGRRRGAERFADRTLDIDLLLYGDQVGRFGHLELPRDEILRYAFVLKPLSDLIPDQRHPQTGQRYLDLWQAMAAEASALTEVQLD